MNSAAAGLSYPADLAAAEDGSLTVTFPDVPEAITQGDDLSDALKRAVDALETALSFYTDAGKELPTAGKPKRGQRIVRPSGHACIKLRRYQRQQRADHGAL